MTTQDEERDVSQSHPFEPFPEPQTIPVGWDTSTLLSPATTDSVMDEVDSSEGEAKA